MTKSELSSKQRRALAALLSERDVTAAARTVGVNPRTIYRYLHLEPFQRALEQQDSQAVDAAARRLIGGLGQALDVLSGLMQSAESESVKRQAASDWANHSMRLLELRTLDNRISQLEREVKPHE